MNKRLWKFRTLYLLCFIIFLLTLKFANGLYSEYKIFKDNSTIKNAVVIENDFSNRKVIVEYKFDNIKYKTFLKNYNIFYKKDSVIKLLVDNNNHENFIEYNFYRRYFIVFGFSLIMLLFSILLFYQTNEMVKEGRDIKKRCAYCTFYIDGFKDIYKQGKSFHIIRCIYVDNRGRSHYIETQEVPQKIKNKILDNNIFTLKGYINRGDLREYYFFFEDVKKY